MALPAVPFVEQVRQLREFVTNNKRPSYHLLQHHRSRTRWVKVDLALAERWLKNYEETVGNSPPPQQQE